MCASLRYAVLCLYFAFDDKAIIKACLDTKIDNTKKLKHIAIVVNNLRDSDESTAKNEKDGKQVSNQVLGFLFHLSVGVNS